MVELKCLMFFLYFSYFLHNFYFTYWVVPEKNPHTHEGWDSGNSCGRGRQRPWKSRRKGVELEKSSAGVIKTDSSRDSNV